MDDTQLQEVIDYTGVSRLQDAYADVVTRQAWDELPSLFTPDCQIDLDLRNATLNFPTAAELAAFIGESLKQFEFFEFVILNRIIETNAGGDPDAATGRMYMCELRQTVAAGRRTDAFGVYDDRYLRTDGRWRFAHRQYHSIGRHGAELDVFSIPERRA